MAKQEDPEFISSQRHTESTTQGTHRTIPSDKDLKTNWKTTSPPVRKGLYQGGYERLRCGLAHSQEGSQKSRASPGGVRVGSPPQLLRIGPERQGCKTPGF